MYFRTIGLHGTQNLLLIPCSIDFNIIIGGDIYDHLKMNENRQFDNPFKMIKSFYNILQWVWVVCYSILV